MEKFIQYNKAEIFCHKAFYKLNDIYCKTTGKKRRFVRPDGTAQEGADAIYFLLSGSAPCMVARYGATELYCLSNYLGIKGGWKNVFRFIRDEAEPWWWAPERVLNMRDCSGFFPLEKSYIERFCEMLIEDSKELDLLGSWLTKETNVEYLIKDKKKIFLPYLEPWYAENPWTRALEGKTVLVVHPFADQIRYQYSTHRERLFSKESILPKFDLKLVKAVQSLGGKNQEGFETWFDALKWMEDEIDKVDYDICLIGCGAYGFPLAAHVKRSGKKAFHMGGALQLLFGIKGNRWEDPMYGVREWGLPENYYNDMFNRYWIRPGEAGRPENAEQVEGACYW